MATLPVSIRLALWTTSAIHGRLPLDRAVERATPDLDDVTGVVDQLAAWRDLGEGVVLAALPGPGDLAGLPRNDGALTAAAVEHGECLYVPGIGAALVPVTTSYGPEDDEGWSLRLDPCPCDPVPWHRLEMLSVRDADRGLREALSLATERLRALGTTWGGTGRELADAALGGGTWGLPAWLDRGPLEVVTRAATISTIVAVAQHSPDPSLTAVAAADRERELRALGRAAERSLEEAAAVASLQIAGWLPGRG